MDYFIYGINNEFIISEYFGTCVAISLGLRPKKKLAKEITPLKMFWKFTNNEEKECVNCHDRLSLEERWHLKMLLFQSMLQCRSYTFTSPCNVKCLRFNVMLARPRLTSFVDGLSQFIFSFFFMLSFFIPKNKKLFDFVFVYLCTIICIAF